MYTNLKTASSIKKNFDVYLKEEIPERYHFSNNPRVGPILVVAKVGYAFQTLYNSIPWYEKEFNITGIYAILEQNSVFLNYFQIIV